MRASGLTGSRIRERRLVSGIKQAELARMAGISAAYLNLIEHNKRRIGGKLLADLARALQIDPVLLAEGAEAALLTDLGDAAASQSADDVPAETVRVEEFAGRFPGWAGLLAAQHRRIAALERTVETLTDRMAHDPHLAASLHDVLSTVTAISATASILVDTADIEGEWRDRFHRNIHEDSQRLAEGAQSLVSYLESASDTDTAAGTPQEELELWLGQRGFHVAELERDLPEPVERVVAGADVIRSKAGKSLAAGYLARYREDAARPDPLAQQQRRQPSITACAPKRRQRRRSLIRRRWRRAMVWIWRRFCAGLLRCRRPRGRGRSGW